MRSDPTGSDPSNSSAPSWRVMVVVGGTFVVIFGLGFLTRDVGDTGVTQSTLPAEVSPDDSDGVPSPEEAVDDAAVSAQVPARAFVEVVGLSVEGVGHLAVLVADEIIMFDLSDGSVSRIGIPPGNSDGQLESVGGLAVYATADGRALALTPAGDTPLDLGMADHVRPSADPSRVWLGVDLPSPHELFPRTSWSEVDVDGTVLKTVLREGFVELVYPDLGWGFSGVYRNTGQPSNRWTFISGGSPLAWGANDLIMYECVSGECSRVWYDPKTGERKGPLLSAVADNIRSRSQGRLSPDARFVASRDGDRLEGWSLSDGTLIAVDCIDQKTVKWSPSSSLLVCNTDDGVTVYDVISYESIRIGIDSHLSYAFVP
jgi:hypothetical protein